MNCPHCGIILKTPGTRCPACQGSLRATCPSCRFKNLLGQAFCGQCGIDLTAKSQAGLSSEPATTGLSMTARYPLLSVEWCNVEALRQAVKNNDRVDALIKEWTLKIETQLLTKHAVIESVRGPILFFSLPQEPHLTQAVEKSLKLATALANKQITYEGVTLSLRVGIDIVSAHEKLPSAAVSERLIATPGQIVVSYLLYDVVKATWPFETLGPVQRYGRMQTYYRLQTEHLGVNPAQKAPEPAVSIVSEQPVEAPAVVVETQEPDVRHHEAVPATTLLPETAAQITEQTEVMKAETPEPKPFEADVEPEVRLVERQFEAVEPWEDVSFSTAQALLPVIEAPKPTIGYMQWVPAVQTEIEAFIEAPSKGGKLYALGADDTACVSNLLNQLRYSLKEKPVYFFGGTLGRAHHHLAQPLGYWAQAFQNFFGFPLDGVLAEPARQHIAGVLKQIYGEALTPQHIEFFETLCGLHPIDPISPLVRERMGQVVPMIGTFFSYLAQKQALVITLENLAYLDAASLAVWQGLLQRDFLKLPISVLWTYDRKQTFSPDLAAILQQQPWINWVLAPCTEEDLTVMAQAPLETPWKKLPDALRAQLVEKASPLFFEEAFRWLYLKGGLTINSKTGQFIAEKNIKKHTPPESVEQIIADRFAALPEEIRPVLQSASVLGERFSPETFAQLLPDSKQAQDLLQHLMNEGFLQQERENMLSFRHGLIWQVVYRSIAEDTLSDLHQWASDYITEQAAKGRLGTPTALALHTTLCGDGEKAIEQWSQVAAWQAALGCIEGANLSFSELAAVDPDIDETALAQLGIGQALVNMDANPEAAKNLFLRALQSLSSLDAQSIVQIQLFLAQIYQRLGQYSHAISTLHRAYETLPMTQQPMESLAVASQEVWLLYTKGHYQEALIAFDNQVQPCLNLLSDDPWTNPAYRPVYGKAVLAKCLIGLSQFDLGSLNTIQMALGYCETQRDPLLGVYFRLAQCKGFLLNGHTERFQQEMDGLFGAIEKLGAPPELMMGWGLLSLEYHISTADWHNAALLLPNLAYQAEQTGDHLSYCLSHAYAGKVALGRGNAEEALALLETGLDTISEYDLAIPMTLALDHKAQALLSANKLQDALATIETALEILDRPNVSYQYGYYQANLTKVNILFAQKQLKAAGTLLEQIWPRILRSGYTPLVAETAILIASLYQQLAQHAKEPHLTKYKAQYQQFLQKAIQLWQQVGNSARIKPYLGEVMPEETASAA